MRDLKRRLQKVNAQLTTVQNIYGKDSSIYKRLTGYVEKAGGGKRFKMSMFDGSLRDVAKAYNTLERIESSAYISKEGRHRIGEEARNTFLSNHDVDDNTASLLFDVFENSAYRRIRDEFGIGQMSEVVVDVITSAIEEMSERNMSKRAIQRNIDDALNSFLQSERGSRDIDKLQEQFLHL